MKQILLLLIPFAMLSQQRDSVVIYNRVFYTGEMYLDSIKINMNRIFLDPENIQDIRSYPGTEGMVYSGVPQATFITRKVKNELVSLEKVKASITGSFSSLKNEARVNLIVNGTLIEHPDEYFIENSAISAINIVASSPESLGTHMWREPSVVITTKATK